MKTIIASTCAAVAAAGLVTACGGGGTHLAPAPAPSNVAGTDVPIAATQSADAAFTFVASVQATTSDSGDPIVVGDAALATSDTEEPKPL
jgi:hypothetical protein